MSAFAIRDCALVTLATGRKAAVLHEFRDELGRVPAASIYHHFWGGLLQPRFESREFNNDFATWARHGLHDGVLAERLAVVDPTRHADLESLRAEVIEQVDRRLGEAKHLAWARATMAFEFQRAQIVVFDTPRTLAHPRELPDAIDRVSTSTIFYHFIDARRRTADGRDDFSDWLTGFGARFEAIRESLADVDPYFGTLTALRTELAALFRSHFSGAASGMNDA